MSPYERHDPATGCGLVIILAALSWLVIVGLASLLWLALS